MQELRSYRPPYATATSMITLIVPPTFQLPLLRQRINHEMTTADNIRNTSNRKSVKAALTRISSYLDSIKSIPSAGMAMFSEQYI